MATDDETQSPALPTDGRASRFESELEPGAKRFLAYVVMHSLDCGRRSPEDFIRHFSPAQIMEGLQNRPSLRAKILVPATGLKWKIAVKKSPGSAGDDLQIALDEGEVDAQTVVGLFEPDDRIRYLKSTAIWSFVTEGAFWRPSNDRVASERAKAHVSFMLDRALADGLVTHQDIVDGISIGKLVELLPRADLGEILAGALDAGRSMRPFTDEDLLRRTPTDILTEHIPLDHIWETVIAPRIASPQGFAESSVKESVPSKTVAGHPAPAAPEAETPFSTPSTSSGATAAASADAGDNGESGKKKPRLKGPLLSKVIPSPDDDPAGDGVVTGTN
jgi:hypothetical protein